MDYSYEVVIPTTGSRIGLLARSIESAKNQTFPPSRIVISWDGESIPIVMVDTLEGMGVDIVSTKKPFSGVSVARNMGIQSTKSDFVALLDDDDYWLESKMERILISS